MAGKKPGETAAEFAARMTEELRQRAEAAAAEPDDEVEEPDIVDDIAAMPAVVAADTEIEVDGVSGEVRLVTLRDRILGGMDPELAKLLSDEDIEMAIAAAQAEAAEVRKQKALAEFRRRAKTAADADAGLVSESVLRTRAERERLAEKVRIKIDLPGGGAGHRGENGFRIDQVLYRNGSIHEVTRAQYESMIYTHYAVWLNELRFSLMNQTQPGMSAIEMLQRSLPKMLIAEQVNGEWVSVH